MSLFIIIFDYSQDIQVFSPRNCKNVYESVQNEWISDNVIGIRF